MRLVKHSQHGDTIVEVLIAIAVAGAVLGGAYTLINSNIKSNQLAQERTSAVKVAESQLELLRAYLNNGGTLPTGNFCFRESNQRILAINANIPSSTDSDYPGDCRFDDGSATNRYLTGIKSDANKFTVYVNWDDPTGSRAQASIAYKAY